MGDLWTPGVSAAAHRAVFAVGRPYATGSQVLGEVTAGDARQQLWARIPVGHALALLSGMLRDVDLEDPSVEAAESGWAGELSEPVRSRALAAVRSGSRLLAPQLLLLAMQEALRFCPPGEARDDLNDVPMVLRAVWSIGDELGHARDEQTSWGGFPATLAADLLASQHFNTAARPLPLIGRTDSMWRHGWSPTVKPRLQA